MMGIRFLERQLLCNIRNLPLILSSPSVVHDRRKKYAGRPVILISAGPSLADEVEWLKQIYREGTAMLFACGSSIYSLLAHGIVPHAIFAVDSGEGLQKLTASIKEENCKDISLFFGDCAGWEALVDYPGEKFWVSMSYGTVSEKLLLQEDGKERFGSGLTVARMALNVAIHLGFSTVIFVGQNLALRGSDRYDEFVPRHEEMRKENIPGIYLSCESVDGEKIDTLYGYEQMRREIEELIAKNPEVKYYNATRGGAAIAGTTYVELFALMERELTKKTTFPGERFDIRKSSPFEKAKIRRRLEECERSKEELLPILKKMFDLVEEVDSVLDFSTSERLFMELNRQMIQLGENLYADVFLLTPLYEHLNILGDFANRIRAERSLPVRRAMIKERYGEFYNLLYLTYAEFSVYYEEMKKTLYSLIGGDDV